MNYKYLLIQTLVMTDFMFTFIGIKAGFYEEANPFMVWLFTLDLFPALLFKFIFTAALLMFLHIKRDHIGKLAHSLINVTLASYMLVNLYHYYAWYITYVPA